MAQFGLGPIGRACVRALVARPGVEITGGIDLDAALAGRDLGEVCELGRPVGVPVRGDAGAALAEWRPQVVLHTTSSFLDAIEDQLALIVASGAAIVSSSEELFYPFERDSGSASRIDAAAGANGVAVLGTGVNPGFVMDLLPLCLTGVCAAVSRIEVVRVVDASRRRGPLQRKVGAGLSPGEFAERASTSRFGHIGLRESALAIAAALRWPAGEIRESLEPVIAEQPVATEAVGVAPGQVAGIHQVLRLASSGTERIVLDLAMYVGAADPHDAVRIEGEPPLAMRIEGGIFGDTATVAALINAIPLVLSAQPGLRTALDLPVPRAFLGLA